MKLLVVHMLIGFAVFVAQSVNIQKLKKTPAWIQHANWKKYMGKWYVFANIHPCTWKGAVQFTDWTHIYLMDYTRKKFTIKNRWRKDGSCSKTGETCTPTSPGSYIVKDQIGDLWSGNVVIVGMDKRFQHYVIRWGCVKYLGDLCADYWASVKTRTPDPSDEIIGQINHELAQLWNTSLAEMDIVPHAIPRVPARTSYSSQFLKWRKY